LLLAVLATYFVWFWTHGGQTLPMKTWHIRLHAAGGGPVSTGRALARFVLCWLWFVPALAAIYVWGLSGGWAIAACLAVGVAAYAALTWLHPTRQYWHDVVCGTRLIDTRPSAGA
jgi:uncharacterized RDD family membrane protein YckC